MDNQLGDNYATRLKVDKLVKNLSMELSYATEAYSDVVDATPALIQKDDEQRFSAGFVYKVGKLGNINAEYIATKNRKGTPDYDPGVISLGLEAVLMDELTLLTKFEHILEDASVDVEEDFVTVALVYMAAKNWGLHLEYSNFNSVNYKDASDLMVADGSLEHAVKLGVRARY